MQSKTLFGDEEVAFLGKLPRLFLMDFEGGEELDLDDLDEIYDAVLEAEQSMEDTTLPDGILDIIEAL